MAVPAAQQHADGCGEATPAFPFPTSTTLHVAAASAVCIAASASACYVSAPLSYYATFAVSLACFARAAWPDRVGAALARAGAYARDRASRARADLEGDLRNLRDAARAHPALAAPVHAAAAEARARLARGATAAAGWAGRARRTAAARWEQHRDATRAAGFVLRLAALVARLAATVLFDAACDEARACAPSVLGYLRGVADGIRPTLPSPSSSSSCDKGVAAAAAGFALKDVVCLVGAGFYLLFTMHLLFSSGAASGMRFCAVCFAATCGLTMLIADWIDPPLDDADETDATAAAAGDESSRDEELEVRESWRFLWVLILVTYCVDAFLLRVTLGPQPTTLAILALCNLEVLRVGRQVQLTPAGDGEGAAEGSAQGGCVDKWRRGAMVVYAACSVKILVVYLVLDCYMAALSFFWLFVMADLLLAEEDNLADFDASGEEDDDEDGEESAGFEGGITGGGEEESDDETREAHSNTSSSEDEEDNLADFDASGEGDDEYGEESAGFEGAITGGGEEDADDEAREEHSNTSSSEDEEESFEHCDQDEEERHCDSSSEDHEIVGEQRRHEGPDYGSGGSTDGSWDLVDVDDDPEMPAQASSGAKRKSRLFPWKHAA